MLDDHHLAGHAFASACASQLVCTCSFILLADVTMEDAARLTFTTLSMTSYCLSDAYSLSSCICGHQATWKALVAD